MSDLELLKRYLQNEIDTGNHKLFVFDKDYNTTELKIIDALNEINDLQNQLQQKENIIKEVREYIEKHLEREYFDYDILEANTIYNRDLYKVLEILDKGSNNEEILDKENKQ